MKTVLLLCIVWILFFIAFGVDEGVSALERMADNTEPTQHEYQVDIDENWMYIYSEEGFIGRVPFNQCPICDSIFIADNQ